MTSQVGSHQGMHGSHALMATAWQQLPEKGRRVGAAISNEQL